MQSALSDGNSGVGGRSYSHGMGLLPSEAALCGCCRRGSPCILPEETLEGYEAAIDAGVDFIEMDAVGTQ